MMRYGCCIGFGGYIPPEARSQGKTSADSFEENVDWLMRNIAFLRSVGYNYVELPTSIVASASDAEFMYLVQHLNSAPIKAEAFNCFVPGSIRLVGNEVDTNAIRSYLELVIPRMAQCGAKVIVFGSGAARSVPQGFTIYKAESQIIDFLKMAADYASSQGMVIAIEPLNSKECNFINLIGDAISIIDEINRPDVRLAIDFYHMNEENDDMEAITMTAGPYLEHVHLADSGRMNPGTGSYDYPSFFAALKEIGYDNRASLECKYRDYENDVKFSLRFLKDAWAEVPPVF